MVYWTMQEAVPLPADIVARFDGKVMAVTGYEADQVMVVDGVETSVPITWAYNHHFEHHLSGKNSVLERVAPASWMAAHGGETVLVVAPASRRPERVVAHPRGDDVQRRQRRRVPQELARLRLAVRPAGREPGHVVDDADADRHAQPRRLDGEAGRPLRARPRPEERAGPRADLRRRRRLLRPPRVPVHRPDRTQGGERVGLASRATVRRRRPHLRGTADAAQPADVLAQLRAVADGRAAEPAQRPTCDIRTYQGGLRCCPHEGFLLDHDQAVPDDVLEYRFKVRFYFQPHDARKHEPVWRWGFSGSPGSDEYDIPKCAAGAPCPSECIHSIVAYVQPKDFASRSATCESTRSPWNNINPAQARSADGSVHLGGHCHAPACLSMELYNDDTGELICRHVPTYGDEGRRRHRRSSPPLRREGVASRAAVRVHARRRTPSPAAREPRCGDAAALGEARQQHVRAHGRDGAVAGPRRARDGRRSPAPPSARRRSR